MNNEPIAWTDKRQLSRPYPHSDAMTMWANAYPEQGIDIPLYTHPVKELSETRIKQIFVEQTGFYFDDNPADDLALMDFAKALLLEAQEK